MNLAFHLAASIAFVFLIGMLLVLQKKNTYLLSFVKFALQRKLDKITVNWPIAYIKSFAEHLAIPIECNALVKDKMISPYKIDVESFYLFVLENRIKSILILLNTQCCVEFHMASPVENLREVEQKLTESLGVMCKIVIEV